MGVAAFAGGWGLMTYIKRRERRRGLVREPVGSIETTLPGAPAPATLAYDLHKQAESAYFAGELVQAQALWDRALQLHWDPSYAWNRVNVLAEMGETDAARTMLTAHEADFRAHFPNDYTALRASIG